MPHIAIIGAGYVGLVTGVCFAQLGYPVVCADKDTHKIALLEKNISPIYEPGLEDLIVKNRAAGRLLFTADTAQAITSADVIFICVGTPPREDNGLPDLTLIDAVAEELSACLTGDSKERVIVLKSTVPVGTTRRIRDMLASHCPTVLAASNPEFLREGSAIADFMQPDRIVVGIDNPRTHAVLAELYAPLCKNGAPLFVTTFESSEMIKYTANTMLAAKVALINEIADICEKLGANIRDVAAAVGMDKRIGKEFLRPGPGFGGSCFPKDALALDGFARNAGAPSLIINALIESNHQRKLRMAEKIRMACGGDLKGKTLAILGLTFKSATDDMREAPSLTILPRLQELGAMLNVYDPQGMQEAKAFFGDSVVYAPSAYAAMKDADALVILTEWNEFKMLDMARVKTLLRAPLVVDLRNIYTRRAMQAAGFHYISVGRGETHPNEREIRDLNPLYTA